MNMSLDKVSERVANQIILSSKKIEIGDKASARFRRGGWMDCVVTHIKTGRKYYEVGLAIEGSGVAWYKLPMSVGYPVYDDKTIKFVGKTSRDELQDAQSQRSKNKGDIETNKRERAEDGYDKIKSLGVQVGDVVLYKFREGSRKVVIGEINARTGKIGIERYRGEESIIDVWINRKRRKFRWLSGEGILGVVKKFNEGFDGESRFPMGKVNDSSIAKMERKGWVQITYGKEFIEDSYVIAITPKGAREGQNYDGSDRKVYLDSDQGFYWRRTGVFD